jgi:hypothetical protein
MRAQQNGIDLRVMSDSIVPGALRAELTSYDFWTRLMIFLNTVGIALFTIVCLVKFFDEDHMHVRDAYGVALPGAHSLPMGADARTAVVPSHVGPAMAPCGHGVHPRACKLGELHYYAMGSAGMLRDLHPGKPVPAFDTLHILWTASWYATPLALLLLASTFITNNNKISNMEWNTLYMVIAAWNVAGLAVQLLIKSVPLYNVYFTLASFIFSCLLVYALREVDESTVDSGQPHGIVQGIIIPPGSKPFQQQAYAPITTGAPNEYGTRAIIPGIHNSYSAMSIVVLQLFFLAPALVAVVASLAQERMTGVMMQHVYWVTTFFISAVVLLQRASLLKHGDSVASVASAAYLLLAIVTGIGFVMMFVPVLDAVGKSDIEVFQIVGPSVVVAIILFMMVIWLVMEAFRNPMPWMQKLLPDDTFHVWHHIGNVVIMIVLFVLFVWWSVVILENKLSMGDAA